MDKPVYANAFSVSYNPSLNETIITFVHEYPAMIIEKDGESKPNTTPCRETVTSVVLPGKVAIQLGEIVEKTISGDTVGDK